jgi:hypothetical protein
MVVRRYRAIGSSSGGGSERDREDEDCHDADRH